MPKSKSRNYLDRYDSPGWFLDCLFKVIRKPKSAIEPCVGGQGLIYRHPDVNWITNDIDPNCVADYHFDATSAEFWSQMPELPVITNPPFNVSHKILSHALRHSKEVYAILRKSWDEPVRERVELLKEFPWKARISMPRFSYSIGDDGTWNTDSCAHDWFIWTEQDVPAFTVFSKNDIEDYTRTLQQELEIRGLKAI